MLLPTAVENPISSVTVANTSMESATMLLPNIVENPRSSVTVANTSMESAIILLPVKVEKNPSVMVNVVPSAVEKYNVSIEASVAVNDAVVISCPTVKS